MPTDGAFDRINDAARDWLRSFPIDEVKRQIADLEREQEGIAEAIAGLRRRLTMWSALSEFTSMESADTPRSGVGQVPSKRDALLALLAEAQGQPSRLVEMREEMIARGWLARTPQAIHALEVAATTLAQRGEVERVKKGVYRLPSRLRLLDLR